MIVIIGGGISGLVLAYRLQKAGKSYILLEKENTAGGLIRSVQLGNYLLETGPNSFLADDSLLAFFNELSLTDQIRWPEKVSKNRYILKNGNYVPMPSGPLGLLFNDFFSLQTRLKILSGFLPEKRKFTESESVGKFFRDRFGNEVAEYAVAPFVSGIYAGDIDRLMVEYTFPDLLRLEKEYGSILRGFVKEKSGPRKQSLNFKNGMESFVRALASTLDSLKTGHAVQQIVPLPDGSWQVGVAHQGAFFFINADKVVITAPSHVAANWFPPSMKSLAESWSNIRYVPMAAVYSAYKKKDIGMELNGFGGLHPPGEGTFLLGSIWTGSIYPERCPPDEMLFTSFVGGDLNQANALLSEEMLCHHTHVELSRYHKIKAAAPVFQLVKKWQNALPQYDSLVGKAWNNTNELEHQGLFVCANWKEGVSLSDCVRKANKMAIKL